jgi:hypothetical protein
VYGFRRGHRLAVTGPRRGVLPAARIPTGRSCAVTPQSPVAALPGATGTGPTTSADVRALVAGLEGAVHVVFTPMRDVVARLDTTGRVKVLYLDCDSPPEDHRWALWEVLRFLALGPGATDAAVPAPRLRLVRD